MEQQPNNTELYKALAEVKKKMTALKKDSNNPFFKSKYADLNAHLQMIEPLLQKNGLVLTQPVISNGQSNYVSTEVIEISTGQTLVSRLMLPQINDLQKLGSAITYARRYTLGALFGMQALDDDAEGTQDRQIKTNASRTKQSGDSLF